MDSEVIGEDLACDEGEYSGNGGGIIGRGSQKSCTDQKQPISPPSVSDLCSTCALPRWESEWNFSIEDGWPVKNTSSFKKGDLMNDKTGKGQKMWRSKARVLYRRPPPVLFSS